MQWDAVKHGFDTIIDIIVKVETVFVIAILGFMIAINTTAIFLRAVFAVSWLWINILTLLLFSWLTFLGAALVFYHREYITITYFVRQVFSKFQRKIAFVVNILVMLFIVFIMIEMPGLIETQFHKMEILPVPTYFLSLPIPIGIGTILLMYISRTWDMLIEGARND